VAFPGFDRLVIVLQGASFRLLVGPVKVSHQTPHVVAMVSHTQFRFDDFGNALSGPQVGAVSMCQGTPEQFSEESPLLSGVEFRGSAGRRLGLQGVGSTGRHGVSPSHDTAGMAPNASGDLVKGESLLQERHGISTPAFQRLGGSMWSHTEHPFSRMPHCIALLMQMSITTSRL